MMLSSKLRSVEGGGLMFRCPGCNGVHAVAVGVGPGPRWGYNGDPARPTFTPSVLVTSGHFMAGHDPSKGCYCTNPPPDERGWGFACTRCHSFVTDGQIQFLDDCTHHLAGQTVDLPDWPEGDAP
jgi:hypothetical protein